MLYMILGEDIPKSMEKRMAARPAHLAHVQELIDAGRMILAGPLPNIDSPILVLPAWEAAFWSPNSNPWKRPRPGSTQTRTSRKAYSRALQSGLSSRFTRRECRL